MTALDRAREREENRRLAVDTAVVTSGFAVLVALFWVMAL